MSPLLNNNLVLNSESNSKFIVDSFRANKLHHAVILKGPEGSGKATFACQIAKWLLSDQAEVMPGGYNINSLYSARSDAVKKIEAGSHPDFMLLNSESTHGKEKKQSIISVDEARELLKFVALKPIEAKYRVIVIDGVDYMNRNAANCILKVLEEPPVNTFIFLVMHSADQVLDTIKSRCITLQVPPLAKEQFMKLFGGNMLIPDANAEALYEISNGSAKVASQLLRSKALEHYIAIAKASEDGKKLTLELLQSLPLKEMDTSLMFKLVLRSLSKKIKAAALNGEFREDLLERYQRLEEIYFDVLNVNLDVGSALLI